MRLVGFLALVVLPVQAFAANSILGRLVPTCLEGGNDLCQACNLIILADNLLKDLVILGGMAAALMLAYAGFLYVTAAATPHNIDSARKIFWSTLLGLIFIIAAWLIIDLALRVLTGKSLDVTSQIQCVKLTPINGGFDVTQVAPTVDAPQSGGSTKGGFCSGGDWNTYNGYVESAAANSPSLMNAPIADIEQFCPKYNSMSSTQKQQFWSGFVRSVAVYESGCDPNSTSPPEPGLGVDRVTGQPVVSEGLMQLSYQDMLNYRGKVPPGVCEFNPGAQDIHDPQKNLTCAMAILDYQVKTQGRIGVGGNKAYWAVLSPTNANSRLTSIQLRTRTLPGCQ